MTKREFLESKGYIRKLEPESMTYDYKKSFDNGIMVINIQLNDFMIEPDCIAEQKAIDDIQIAFNNLQSDFKEMQKYGD